MKHGSLALIAASLLSTASSFADSIAETAEPEWFRGLGPLEETVRSIGIDYYVPHTEFDEDFRDIEVAMLSQMRGWRTASGVELQLGGGVLLADGVRWEPFSADPPRDSQAYGLTAGGLLRYNFPEVLSVRPFIDGALHVLWTERPFPAGGSALNGLLRFGGGFAVPIGPSHTLDFGYRLAHISNGGADSTANPAWSGEGIFLSWRKKIH